MTISRESLSALLVLLTALAVLTIPGCTSSSNLSYSALVAEIKDDNVAHVELTGDQAIVRLKKPPKAPASNGPTYRVTIPPGDKEMAELTQLLQEHEVGFTNSDP